MHGCMCVLEENFMPRSFSDTVFIIKINTQCINFSLNIYFLNVHFDRSYSI